LNPILDEFGLLRPQMVFFRSLIKKIYPQVVVRCILLYRFGHFGALEVIILIIKANIRELVNLCFYLQLINCKKVKEVLAFRVVLSLVCNLLRAFRHIVTLFVVVLHAFGGLCLLKYALVLDFGIGLKNRNIILIAFLTYFFFFFDL
jgi:hypothetical protein